MFNVLMVVIMKSIVLRDVTPCILVDTSASELHGLMTQKTTA